MLIDKNNYWQPPSIGHIKLNKDASVFHRRGFTGVRLVFRDHTCRVLAVISKHFDVEIMELLAIRDGV